MNRIAFAVLHYCKLELTTRCVDSLLLLDVPKDTVVDIIIVDNNSPDGSGFELEERYKNNDKITLIKSRDNLGFAKGNNLAFYAMKDKFYDFGIFLNNDTEIIQKDFLFQLIALKNSDVALWSVDVFDPAVGQHQSPLCDGSDLIEYAKREHLGKQKVLNCSFLNKLLLNIKAYLAKIAFVTPFFRKAVICYLIKSIPQSQWEAYRQNIVPCGAAVVFSKHFLQSMPYAFYPGTSMYFEECILKLLCDRKGLITAHNPDLQVLHHHHRISVHYFDKFLYSHLAKEAHLYEESYEVLLTLLNQ